MSVIVYLGPSLARREAEALLQADYRPPVRRGDLRACPGGGDIGIIDGEFGQSLSVSPKEILEALDRGVRVLGAASMGALRAAELHAQGMMGIGRVFDAYRSGHVRGDDEVAVAYSPVDLAPCTVPLINVRFWLDDARARRALSISERRRLFAAARRIFFAARTPERLRRAFADVMGDALEALWPRGSCFPDAKAEDARLLLRHMADGAGRRTKGRMAYGKEA